MAPVGLTDPWIDGPPRWQGVRTRGIADRRRRRSGLLPRTALCALVPLVASSVTACAAQTPRGASTIQPDERIVLFPTLGHRQADGAGWEIHVHGWIFEREIPDAWIAEFVEEIDDVEWGLADAARVTARIAPFLVDNERGKRVALRVGAATIVSEPSGPDGHFSAMLNLADALLEPPHEPTEESPPADAPRATADGPPPGGDGPRPAAPATGPTTRTTADALRPRRITYRVLLPSTDARTFTGEVHLIPPRGVSVISDIDDTVRISDAQHVKSALRSTFLRPFRAVEGIPQLYAGWSRRGDVAFHYVSGSPWQLYQALRAFFDQAGLPPGSFHLRRARYTGEGLRDLRESGFEHKRELIEPLLAAYPQRRFVLVGDSGEQDPELYGSLARRFPGQVVRVLIRDVTGEAEDAPRYRDAFAGLPRSAWRVFRGAAEIADALPDAEGR